MSDDVTVPEKSENVLPAHFDPDAASTEGSGMYGLPFAPEDSRVIVIPVPFEATTSYGGGTSKGPMAIFEASKQVDLFDHETGRPYAAGIAMLEIAEEIEAWNDEAKELAATVIAKGGAVDPEAVAAAARVNGISERVNSWVYRETKELLAQGKFVAVLGGDHAVPYGSMRAHAERHPGMGILHLDAHADLRQAYEGFIWSHASIFNNVMTNLEGVATLVQVGIRDLGQAERKMIDDSGGRIVAFYDADLAVQKDNGVPFAKVADEIIAALPDEIYLSWDIDGLDPTLCPGTGTPVPGGLSWNEALSLLRAIVRAKKRIIGLDLCEVSPGGTEWDANVGARLLYKMIGFALLTLQSSKAVKL